MKFLMEFFFVLIFGIFTLHHFNAEPPLSSCGEEMPFKTMNNSCSSFDKICIKIGDKECDNFRNVCKQCPPSNYSVIMFIEMKDMKNQLTTMKDKLILVNNLATQCEIRKFLYVISFGILIIFIVLVIEIRFKLLTKCCRRNDVPRYEILKSRKLIRENDPFKWDYLLTEIDKVVDSQLESKLNVKMNDVVGWIEKILESPSNVMEFKISGFSKHIKLNVHSNENVVQIKRRICTKLPTAKPDDYKIMIIKFGNKKLQDNNYLMSQIDSSEKVFICEMDYKMDPSKYLICKLQSNRRVPDLIQIQKTMTILELKNNLTIINKFSSTPILKDMKTDKELRDEQKLGNCNLLDDDWIKVIVRVTGDLMIETIFSTSQVYSMRYSNFNLINEFKENFVHNNNFKAENVVFFIDKMEMENEKYIYDYDIDNKSNITFCSITPCINVEKVGHYIDRDDIGNLYKGKYKDTNYKILIKSYSLRKNLVFQERKDIIKELNTVSITKMHPRFSRILGIYLDNLELSITMEYEEEGTLVMFLRMHFNLPEEEISKWCFQILDGLQFLHSNDIIHANLRPTNILVDSKRQLKLINFNPKIDIYSVEECLFEMDLVPLRYCSPEMLKGDEYGTPTDIWSFGAVLIYIVTETSPYSSLGENEAANEIIKSSQIKFSYPKNLTISDNLKEFISLCLKSNPADRKTTSDLLENDFVK